MRTPLLMLAVLLLAAVAAVPPAHAQASEVLFAFPGGGTVTVDAITQRDSRIRFDFTTNASTPDFRAVFVTLSRVGQSLDIDLGSQPGRWVGFLEVNTPELVLATWQVRLYGIDQGGAQVPISPAGANAPRTLVVGGTDTAAPTVAFAGAVNKTVLAGPEDVVRVNVADDLLRFVTYRVPGLPRDFRLNAPYELAAGNFLEGNNTLTVTATDRAGKSTTANVTVTVDSKAPVVAITRVPVAQVGVPYQVKVNVKESTPYEVRLVRGNVTTIQTAAASPSGRDHTFTFTPTTVGNLTYRVQVRDALANVNANTTSLPVLLPAIDAQATGLRVLQTAIAGNPTRFAVDVRQLAGAGIVTVPRAVNLTVTLDGLALPGVPASIPATGNLSKEFSALLSIGVHSVKVRVEPFDETTDPAAANNEASLQVEVFLAKVTDGNRTYFIRSSGTGQPGQAVDAAGTYPLRLVDYGISSAYSFTAHGVTRLYVPGQNATVDPAASTSSGTVTGDKDSKDSPGPVFALVALGLLAFAGLRRRKA